MIVAVSSDDWNEDVLIYIDTSIAQSLHLNAT